MRMMEVSLCEDDISAFTEKNICFQQQDNKCQRVESLRMPHTSCEDNEGQGKYYEKRLNFNIIKRLLTKKKED